MTSSTALKALTSVLVLHAAVIFMFPWLGKPKVRQQCKLVLHAAVIFMFRRLGKPKVRQQQQSEKARVEELIAAASSGEKGTVVSLLDQVGQVLDIINRKSSSLGWSALYAAAVSGELEVVKLLVERGADIDSVVELQDGFFYDALDYDGDTALIGAAVHDHLGICIYLVKQGSDLRLKNMKGLCALTAYGTKDEHLAPDTLLNPPSAVLSQRRLALHSEWRKGPHASQVSRREETWRHLAPLLMMTHKRAFVHLPCKSDNLYRQCALVGLFCPATRNAGRHLLEAHALSTKAAAAKRVVFRIPGLARLIAAFLRGEGCD